MKPFPRMTTTLVLAALCLVTVVSCRSTRRMASPAVPPLGTKMNRILMQQEDNAEAAKFIIYSHEFELNEHYNGVVRGHRLNSRGEDHVKQIAAEMKTGNPQLVMIERSETSARANTKYQYPVHLNDQLDRQRREVVVAALTALGVPEPESMVVVAPAFPEGINSEEATNAYYGSLRQSRGGYGYGGGFGGGFGRGGF